MVIENKKTNETWDVIKKYDLKYIHIYVTINNLLKKIISGISTFKKYFD